MGDWAGCCLACRAALHRGSGTNTLLRNALQAVFESQPLTVQGERQLSAQTHVGLGLYSCSLAFPDSPALHSAARPAWASSSCTQLPKMYFYLKTEKKAIHTKTAKRHTETPHEAPSPAMGHQKVLHARQGQPLNAEVPRPLPTPRQGAPTAPASLPASRGKRRSSQAWARLIL